VRAILEYFGCMIGSIAEARSRRSARSGSGKLRVWFSCSQFVLSECGTKVTAP
jgi:hypothetical protein